MPILPQVLHHQRIKNIKCDFIKTSSAITKDASGIIIKCITAYF